jgi:hypothetical protein
LALASASTFWITRSGCWFGLLARATMFVSGFWDSCGGDGGLSIWTSARFPLSCCTSSSSFLLTSLCSSSAPPPPPASPFPTAASSPDSDALKSGPEGGTNCPARRCSWSPGERLREDIDMRRLDGATAEADVRSEASAAGAGTAGSNGHASAGSSTGVWKRVPGAETDSGPECDC